MRLSLRFVLPLMLVLAGIAYAIAPLVDRLTLGWFVRDLDVRATLIVNTIQEPLQEQLAARKQAKIVLATLNRLRGVDDTAKRAKLIKELFDEFEGDKDMLERLLPETERSLNSLLKIADREFDGVMSELEREDERGVLEDRFSQIVNPDEAKKLANIATAGEDFGNELELVFVFDDEKDYYKVANFFDGTDKTRKLIELVDGRSKSKSNK